MKETRLIGARIKWSALRPRFTDREYTAPGLCFRDKVAAIPLPSLRGNSPEFLAQPKKRLLQKIERAYRNEIHRKPAPQHRRHARRRERTQEKLLPQIQSVGNLSKMHHQRLVE